MKNTVTISKEFWFSASHRIEGHPKCGRLHGHNYKVTVTVEGILDERGMVIDFGDLKAKIKPIIDRLDHYTIFSASNIEAEPELFNLCKERGWAVLLPIKNATAEEIARYLHVLVNAVVGDEMRISIAVEETQESHGTAFYGDE